MRFRIELLCVLLGFGMIIPPQAGAQDRKITHNPLTLPDGAESLSIPKLVWTEEEQVDERAVYIVDDFEDGNINGWLGDGTQSCSASISSEVPFGSFSMRIDGACFPFNGYYFEVGNAAPTDVYLYVRSETTNTSDTFFVLGEDFHEVVSFSGGPGEWRVYDGASHSCGPRNPQQWYYIHFVIDWACKVYDVFIDGQLKLTNVNFYDPTVTGISRIHVFNMDNTSAWYDEIYFGTPGISPLIFADDFERGSTCRWSNVVN
ncbi:MAG: hypothetical protein DRJ61_19475 [Acidobacteria bacterium]|nr:MAG: hypothetical protein DRJ61_19475 [Acidobacteriota bacterium]